MFKSLSLTLISCFKNILTNTWHWHDSGVCLTHDRHTCCNLHLIAWQIDVCVCVCAIARVDASEMHSLLVHVAFASVMGVLLFAWKPFCTIITAIYTPTTNVSRDDFSLQSNCRLHFIERTCLFWEMSFSSLLFSAYSMTLTYGGIRIPDHIQL